MDIEQEIKEILYSGIDHFVRNNEVVLTIIQNIDGVPTKVNRHEAFIQNVKVSLDWIFPKIIEVISSKDAEIVELKEEIKHSLLGSNKLIKSLTEELEFTRGERDSARNNIEKFVKIADDKNKKIESLKEEIKQLKGESSEESHGGLGREIDEPGFSHNREI